MFPLLISVEAHKLMAAVRPRFPLTDTMLCNNKLSSHAGDFGHLAEPGRPLLEEEHRIVFLKLREALHVQNSPWVSVSRDHLECGLAIKRTTCQR